MTRPSAPARLAEILRAEGGLLGAAAADPDTLRGLGDVLGDGTHGDAERALATEAIHEGYLLHYGQPQVLSPAAEPDLALLAGDRLYALGLERLAALGDLPAIAALAQVIAEGSQAHAAGQPQRAAEAWSRGTRAVARQVGTDVAPGQ